MSLRITKGESPSSEEAAAAIAAIEQFLRDTAIAPEPDDDTAGGWLRTARLEAVDREPIR